MAGDRVPVFGRRRARAARAMAAGGALASALIVSACQTATPERVLRDETALAAAPERPLCQRMAQDFNMTVVDGNLLTGRVFQVNLIDTIVSARGVSFSLKLVDDRPEEDCTTSQSGVTCAVVGPATVLVRSNVGAATYVVAPGDAARVETAGARLSCREPGRPHLAG